MYLFCILTDLSKQSTDNALDEDQCPCESELLLLVSLTIVTSSAEKVRETTLCCMQKITDNESETGVACNGLLGRSRGGEVEEWSAFMSLQAPRPLRKARR